jgi:hypothetical protein
MLADAGASRTEILDLREATELAQNLDEILRDAGYRDLRASYQRSFKPVAKEALSYYKKLGIAKPTAGIDGQIINALRDGYVRDLELRVHSKLIQPLQERIIQSTISLRNRRDVIADITNTINGEGILRRDGRRFYDFNTEVLVNESHMRFYRSVRQQKADDLGMDIFMYFGPNDKVTRPTCREILMSAPHGIPGMFYRDEINVNMAAGLIANPMTAGGGWNCRHKFLPVRHSDAKAMGFQVQKRRLQHEVRTFNRPHHV